MNSDSKLDKGIDNMSVDEAIDFANDINRTVTFSEDCKRDEEFFNNVESWLEELKHLRRWKSRYCNDIVEDDGK